MSYSVGKAVRELNNKNDNISYLSGDDYFLQKFFIDSLEKTYSNEYKTRYFNFEEEMDVKIFFEEIVSNSYDTSLLHYPSKAEYGLETKVFSSIF